MIRLALLRHGHTPWNRAHRIQGRSDIPLDAEAEDTLRALRLPPPWDRTDMVASPLSRAMQTGVLLGGSPAAEPALMEMDWGDWEGRRGADLRAELGNGFPDIEAWGWEWAPPGGESPATLRTRLIPWAERLASDTVAICHIGVMRVLLAHASGWDFDGPAPFAVKRNRLYVIEIGTHWRAWPEPVRLEPR
ncbi:MAG: histidine phosphatase family protein [Pseudomonadota bacterium]